jgi:hypothetical protein
MRAYTHRDHECDRSSHKYPLLVQALHLPAEDVRFQFESAALSQADATTNEEPTPFVNAEYMQRYVGWTVIWWACSDATAAGSVTR